MLSQKVFLKWLKKYEKLFKELAKFFFGAGFLKNVLKMGT